MPDSAEYIADLNVTLPAADDPVKDGDNEIRTLKTAIKNSFAADPTGVYNDDDPDVFDGGDGVLAIGPRYLNSLPNQLDAIVADITTLEATSATLVTAKIPVGAILIWSGSEGAIPAGWKLCNGANGTPDLRDRFVVGAGTGGSYAVGDTGGAASVSSSSDGAHDHAITVDNHALTVAEMPAHGHPWIHWSVSSGGPNSSNGDGGFLIGNNPTTYTTRAAFDEVPTSTAGEQIGGAGEGDAHNHTASAASESDHSHTVDTLPPYYALCYIMFTG